MRRRTTLTLGFLYSFVAVLVYGNKVPLLDRQKRHVFAEMIFQCRRYSSVQFCHFCLFSFAAFLFTSLLLKYNRGGLEKKAEQRPKKVMQSARFGVAWLVHQTLPRLCGGEEKEALALSAAALAYVMPCRYCRESYSTFRRCARAEIVLQDEQRKPQSEAEEYYFLVHNLVNAKLDKPIVTQKCKDYKICASAKEWCEALLEWLMIVAMNYEHAELCFVASSASFFVRLQQSLLNTKWLEIAQQKKKDIADVVNEWIAEKAGGAEEDRLRRFAWHVLYVDSVLRIADRNEATAKCSELFREEIFGDRNALFSKERFVGAILRIRKRLLGNKQESNTAFLKRISSYRANQCSAGACQ